MAKTAWDFIGQKADHCIQATSPNTSAARRVYRVVPTTRGEPPECFGTTRSVACRDQPKRETSRIIPAGPFDNAGCPTSLATSPLARFKQRLPYRHGPARVGLDLRKPTSVNRTVCDLDLLPATHTGCGSAALVRGKVYRDWMVEVHPRHCLRACSQENQIVRASTRRWGLKQREANGRSVG